LRADKVGDEYGKQYIIKGNGDEYQRINEVKSTNAPIILPLNFPLAYDVEDPFDAGNVTLADMKHWEMAPLNAFYLEKKNITFTLTTSDLKNKADFWKNLRKAIKHGLSEAAALKALTYTPAYLLKVSDQLGSLEKGKIANFIITSTNVFEDDNMIYQNWVKGERYIVNDYLQDDIRGTYQLTLDGVENYTLEITYFKYLRQ